MRYELNHGILSQVKKIVLNGFTITNPTDAQIDEAGAGYALLTTSEPEYDSETQTLSSSWELEGSQLVKVWTVVDIPQDVLISRQIQALDAQIQSVNEGYEAFKNTPILFTDGKGYLPRWVPEFYTPALVLGESVFPMMISATDGTSRSFTFTEFQTLFSFLVQQSSLATATTNAQLLELETEKLNLQNGVHSNAI